MRTLTLIRGLPGSGKSTLAKKQSGTHVEADMFFMQNNVYCYNPLLVERAHQWCESQVTGLLEQGLSVVVSNTFIQWWQIEPYILLAKRQHVTVKMIEACGCYQNIHNVPEEVIARMKTAYEDQQTIMKKIQEILPVSQLCLL